VGTAALGCPVFECGDSRLGCPASEARHSGTGDGFPTAITKTDCWNQSLCWWSSPASPPN